MATRLVRLLWFGASMGVLALARIPAVTPMWAYVTLGACLTVLCLAVFVAWRPERAPRALPLAVLAGSLAALLIPASPDAWLAAVPDWAVAALLVVSLHLFYGDATAAAPSIEGPQAASGRGRRMAAYLPFAVAVAALILAPLAYGWFLPPRIRAAYELQGALTPLAPLLLLAAALVLAGGLRSLARRGPTEPAKDAGTAGPEGADP